LDCQHIKKKPIRELENVTAWQSFVKKGFVFITKSNVA
jgi:hypothetical protein